MSPSSSSQILTEDYSKAAFLCADRTVTLHARFGQYYKTRVPKYGRDLAYGAWMPRQGGKDGRKGGGGISRVVGGSTGGKGGPIPP